MIVLTLLESEEQIISGIPEYIEFETDVPANIFYTLDGTDPTIESLIALGKVYLPTSGLTLTVKAIALSADGSSEVLTQLYSSDSTELDGPRNIGEGISVLPFGSSSVNNLSFDAEGYAAQESSTDFVDLDIKASIAEGDNETSVSFINFAEAPTDDDSFSSSSVNDNVYFDSKAKLIIIDGSTDEALNNQQVKLINRTYNSFDPTSNLFTERLGQKEPIVTGNYVRSYYNPVTKEYVSFYYESVDSRWIISKQKLENTVIKSGYPSNRRGCGGRFVYRWIESPGLSTPTASVGSILTVKDPVQSTASQTLPDNWIIVTEYPEGTILYNGSEDFPEIEAGETYRFVYDESLESDDAIGFTYDGITSYEDGITREGNPGDDGAYLEWVVDPAIPSPPYGDELYVYIGDEPYIGEELTVTGSTFTSTPSEPTIDSIAEGDGQVSVSVTPGNDGGSEITDYEYTTDGGSTWISIGSTASPLVISPLVNGVEYNIQIRPVNDNGSGESSSIFSATPSTVPGQPTISGITTGDQELTVSVTGDNGGSAITDYEYSLNGGPFISAGTAVSPFTITGLTNGTSYDVVVQAVNANGTGTPSAATTAIPSTAPSQPTIDAITAGDGELTVAFTAGDDGGSALTDIEYTLDGTNWVSAGTTAITGITQEGPASNQTGTNVMDAGEHGWISLDEQLGAGERLVLDNAFFTDFLGEAVGTNNIFAIGIKGDNWTNTFELNNVSAAASGEIFKGDTYLVGLCNNLGTGVEFRIISGSTTGNSMSTTPSIYGTVCAFLEVTSSGNDIRLGFGRNGDLGVAAGDESTVTYADWTAYKQSTGDQGYGITSADVVMSFWTFDGGDIDGAEIDWTLLSVLSDSVPTSPFTITGLTNGVTYPIQIRPVNANGTGTPSTVTNATPATTPAAPTIDSVTSGDEQLTVAFTAGSDGGSAITDYEYSLDGGAFVSAGTAVSPFTITGLTNGQTYSVVVRAVNAEGNGTSSAAVPGTPSTIPDAPTLVSLTPGDAQLSVDFTLNGTGGSAITDVEYRINGTGSWFSASTTSSPFVIGSLVNGVSYSVEVRAINSNGASSASNSITSSPTSSWEPTDVSIVAWVDASDTSSYTLSGSTLTAVTDKAGTYTLSVGGTPTRVVAGRNGLNTFDFDGSGEYLQSTTFSTQVSSGNHWAIGVFRPDVADGTKDSLWSYETASSPKRDYAVSSGATGSWPGELDLDALSSNRISSTIGNKQDWNLQSLSLGSWAIVVAIFNKTGNQISCRANGSDAFTPVNDYDNNVQASQQLRLMRNRSSEELNGQMAEFFAVAGLPGTGGTDISDIEKAEGYLAWKWGLEGQLPSGHPYKSSPP